MNASKSIAPNSWINHSKNKNSLYHSTLCVKHVSNLRNWYIVLKFQKHWPETSPKYYWIFFACAEPIVGCSFWSKNNPKVLFSELKFHLNILNGPGVRKTESVELPVRLTYDTPSDAGMQKSDIWCWRQVLIYKIWIQILIFNACILLYIIVWLMKLGNNQYLGTILQRKRSN